MNEKTPEILSTYYFRLCNVLQARGRLDEALQTARDCETVVAKLQEQRSEPIPPSFWSGVWQLYSNVYLQMNEYDKAEAYIDRIDSLGIASLVLIKNNYRKRARIMEHRKDYDKALEYINLASVTYPNYSDYTAGNTYWIKARILSQLGRTDEAMECLIEAAAKTDSIRDLDFNRQLDELRVIHEVDTLTAEKELTRRRYTYALAGCALLLVAMGLWIYYSNRLRTKNIILTKQILEQSRLYDEAKAHKKEIQRLRHNLPLHNELTIDIPTTDNEVEEEKESLFEKLELYMEDYQPYTNPSLNRKMLSDALNTNEKYLYDCIMENAGITVSDYITGHRLSYANKLLQKPNREYTIEEIAKISGFGSRNRFYDGYRAIYGITPTEFLNLSEKNPNRHE